MAFSVTQRVISSEDMIYSYCDDFCRKAKLLYPQAQLLEADTMTSPAELAKVWGRQDAFTHAMRCSCSYGRGTLLSFYRRT